MGQNPERPPNGMIFILTPSLENITVNLAKTLILFIVATVSMSQTTYAFDHTHPLWNATLKKYLDSNSMFQYGKLKSDLKVEGSQHSFPKYLDMIKKLKGSTFQAWNKSEQMAFLINAYNALTVELILSKYPIESIKNLGSLFSSPWKKDFFSILDNKAKTLDQIEHEILRPNYRDYRIHAAVNCASISCPVLRPEAYEGSKLNSQLDEQMKIWINDKSRNQISNTKKVKISKIFDWYKDDFEDWGKGVVNVLRKYSTSPIADKDIDIDYLKYNWNLNDSMPIKK